MPQVQYPLSPDTNSLCPLLTLQELAVLLLVTLVYIVYNMYDIKTILHVTCLAESDKKAAESCDETKNALYS